MSARTGGPAVAVLPATAGAVVCLIASGQVWVRATAEGQVLGAVPVTLSGREVAPVVPAVALVALAGAVALTLGRRLGRRVAGLLLVVAGASGAAAALEVARSPSSSAQGLVARAVGTATTGSFQAAGTGWPWVGGAGAALVVVGGVVAVFRARAWGLAQGAASSRYEAGPAGPAAAVRPLDPRRDPGAAWDALTLGRDPTGPAPGSPKGDLAD
jgi:uncharacterized membrane protein (TIGR02234 family)